MVSYYFRGQVKILRCRKRIEPLSSVCTTELYAISLMVAALTAVQNVDHNGFSLLVPVHIGRTESEKNRLALILMTKKVAKSFNNGGVKNMYD